METIDAFNTVLEVARLNNFSRAAEKLDLSTSSVSRQVTEFEQWLGTSVFQRTTRRVSLTKAGGLFLERMQDIAVSIQSLRDEAGALAAIPRGRLRITAAPSSMAHKPGCAGKGACICTLLIRRRLLWSQPSFDAKTNSRLQVVSE